MQAFVRVSDQPIRLHCAVVSPDFVVVIDRTLLETGAVTEGLSDGPLVADSPVSPKEFADKLGQTDGSVATVNPLQIALGTAGGPYTNIPRLGALVRAAELAPLDFLETIVRDALVSKIGEDKAQSNLEGLRQAYEEVMIT